MIESYRAAFNADEFAAADSLVTQARAHDKGLGRYHEASLRFIEAVMRGDGVVARAAIERAAAIAPNSRAGFDYAASLGRERSRGVSALKPGDQFGNFLTVDFPGTPVPGTKGISAGDTLRAFINTPNDLGSGWALESNGNGTAGNTSQLGADLTASFAGTFESTVILQGSNDAGTRASTTAAQVARAAAAHACQCGLRVMRPRTPQG